MEKRTEITFVVGNILPLVPLSGASLSLLKPETPVHYNPYSADTLMNAVNGGSTKEAKDLVDALAAGNTMTTEDYRSSYDLTPALDRGITLRPVHYRDIPPALVGLKMIETYAYRDAVLRLIKDCLVSYKGERNKGSCPTSALASLFHNQNFESLTRSIVRLTQRYDDMENFERALRSYDDSGSIGALIKDYRLVYVNNIKPSSSVVVSKVADILKIVRHVKEYLTLTEAYFDGRRLTTEDSVRSHNSFLNRTLTTASDVRTSYAILSASRALMAAETTGQLLSVLTRYLAYGIIVAL